MNMELVQDERLSKGAAYSLSYADLVQDGSKASSSTNVQRSDLPSQTLVDFGRKPSASRRAGSRDGQDSGGLRTPPAPADGRPRLESAREWAPLRDFGASTDLASTAGPRSSTFLRFLRARLMRWDRVLGEMPRDRK